MLPVQKSSPSCSGYVLTHQGFDVVALPPREEFTHGFLVDEVMDSFARR
jgi:hypothetical protein